MPLGSVALVNHIRVLDWRYISDRRRGMVTPAAMDRIDAAIRIGLGVA